MERLFPKIVHLLLVLTEPDRGQVLDGGETWPDVELPEDLDDDGRKTEGLARTRRLRAS